MKKFFFYLMVVLYVAAGINHFINPQVYLRIMPRPFPYPLEAVYLSGFLESLFGIGLVFAATRRWSAWGLILLLIAVFPANVNMAIHHESFPVPVYFHYIRIPLQFVLIWWAYLYTKPGALTAQAPQVSRPSASR